MKRFINNIYLIAIMAIVSAVMVGCNGEEENFSWRPGEELLIYGDSEAPLGTTVTFSVAGYTIKKTYSWTVTGAGASTTTGSGEFLDVAFNQLGTFTITVSDGKDQGTFQVTSVSKVISLSEDVVTVRESTELDTIAIPISIDFDIVSETSISYALSGTAVEGVDYELLSANPLVVEEGDDLEILIRLLPDTQLDPNDTIKITLTAVSSAIANEVVLDEDAVTATYEIKDDLKVVAATDVETVVYDTENPHVHKVVITLSSPSSVPVTVNYSITAPNGGVADVTPTGAGSVTFEPGETSRSVYIQFAPAAFNADQDVTFSITGINTIDDEVSVDPDADGKLFKIQMN